MIYSKEVENMCTVKCGASHGCAPIPEEGKWVYSREIKDISGLTHGIGSVSYTHLCKHYHDGKSITAFERYHCCDHSADYHRSLCGCENQ